jgi:glycosyltransferase involved in cell wall biosynthesis
MNVRRVLLATDAIGGVWTYTLELACALREHGVEAVLAVLGAPPHPAQLSAAEGLRVIDTGLPLDWVADHPRDVRRAGAQLSRIATDEGAEIVQLHSAALACDVPFEQPVVAVQHSCVASWWECVRGGMLPHDFAWRRDMVGCGLHCADAVVAPTAAFATQTARIYGLNCPVQAVHNGRQRIGLPRQTQANSILTIGRLWDDGKNVRTLDEAAAFLDVPITAVGPLRGPNTTAVSFKHLRTCGALGERAVAEHLAARPIFASSALYEPFGLSALEAAQAGCALVLSDIPTFRELWQDAAIFVAATDAPGFANAFGELLRDPERREQLGRAARLRAFRYAPDAMARQMAQIYEQVATPAASTAPFAVAGAA